MHLFGSLKVSTCWNVFSEYLSGNIFSTCWNATTAQIILKGKNDIDSLCPNNSSPRYILLLQIRSIKLWNIMLSPSCGFRIQRDVSKLSSYFFYIFVEMIRVPWRWECFATSRTRLFLAFFSFVFIKTLVLNSKESYAFTRTTVLCRKWILPENQLSATYLTYDQFLLS